MRSMLIAILLTYFFTFGPACAEPPPVHPSQQLDAERAESEARKAKLETEAKTIAAEMEKTQSALLSLARDIQKTEEKMTALETRISESQTEQKEIEERLKKDRGTIGQLILSLDRLNRTPPEALIARPGAPLETAQSAMILQGILPDIYARAERLKKDIARLDDLLTQLENDRVALREATEKLEGQQKELSLQMTERKRLYTTTQAGIKTEEIALRQISKRASSLKDLVARLGERQKDLERTHQTAQPAAAASSGPVASVGRPTPLPRPGSPQLPVSGTIRVGYKQTDDIGAESQGLTIESRPSALVVAPMGGIVRYAGTFKNYGQIVIVEHQKDYHSLIAGLDKIDTVVGQAVKAGEPLGKLGKSSTNGNPTVYYELRFRGEPVNPSTRFSGL